MEKNLIRRFLGMALSIAMVFSMLPTALAAEDTCEHHIHDESCGYSEGTPGSDCTHSHDEACGYTESVEGSCTHTHDEACGYSEAVPGTPCAFVCNMCTQPTENAPGPSEPVETEPEGTEPAATEPEGTETEEPEETEPDGTQATEPEETEPEELVEADGRRITVKISTDCELPENEELFHYYVERELYGYDMATFGAAARERLTTIEQGLYDALKVKIEAVAAVGGSTVFGLSNISGLKTTWTNEELGVASIEDDSVVEAAFFSQFSGENIVRALNSDCPFDLYWFDKTIDVEISWWLDVSGADNGTEVIWNLAEISDLTFSFRVAEDYRGDVNAVTENVAKVSAAKTEAAQVVANNASKSDRDKLLAYKDYICAAVSYDYSAVNDSTTPYGDPWQLISVFDGDSGTNVVCEGYSKAFQYLCDMTAFSGDTVCNTVTGPMQGVEHMWNIVTIDGINYLVDVTNSDSGTSGQFGDLFLVGGTGSAVDGYTVFGLFYAYDSETLNFWGADADSILNLPRPLEEKIVWSLDEATGVLTIAGTGPMPDLYPLWFGDAESVRTVVIKDGVTSIGENAFAMSNITSVTIPGSVKHIGVGAFGLCGSLVSVEIPEGVTTIAMAAFNQCESLSSIALPASLTEVDFAAFADAPVTSVYITDLSAWLNINWTEHDAHPFCSDTGNKYQGNLYLNGELLTDVVIPDGFTSVDQFAFFHCDSIERVTIPEGVTTIGEGAFSYCQNLKYMSFPDSLRTIERFAFEGSGVLSIMLPDGVTTIKDGAFQNSKNLASVTIPDTVSDWGEYIFAMCYNLTSVTLPDNLTHIPPRMFHGCLNLPTVTIPDSVTSIGEAAFVACHTLESITIPAGVESIGGGVFGLCSSLSKIYFEGDPPAIGCTEYMRSVIGYYPEGNEKWTEEVLQNYREATGITNWQKWTPPKDHKVEDVLSKAPTCTEPGLTAGKKCSVCGEVIVAQEIVPALGHEMGPWTAIDEEMEQRQCSRCDHTQTRRIGGNILVLPDEEFANHDTVWIDGQPVSVEGEGEERYVDLPTGEETMLVAYTWHIGDEADIHTKYPTGMKVYRIVGDENGFTAEYIPEMDNLLQYSGASIRIVGVKGIRMITSITKGNKSALTGEGLAGYTLEEYGTALCWATDLAPGEDLVLGKEYTRSNYAYKKGVADPIFAQTADLIQYTNVLVGFSDDQCIPDIVMRPYIILSDAEGNQVTLYGGSIHRSIGYIAYQNRNVFQPGNASYDYVWGIIHHVYGDQFDEDYKG